MNIMKIEIKREIFGKTYTAGTMNVDGKKLCDTLEPHAIDWTKEEKTPGKTAIPAGTYKLEMCYSPKFKTRMPYIVGVPHFEGIMIHVGNSVRETRGCVLVGERTFPSVLTHSRNALNRLLELLDKRIGETIIVKISQ